MKKRSNVFGWLCLLMVFTTLPAFAGNPHSTPGLEPSVLTGLAAVGYMGYQSFKAYRNKR